MSYIISIDLLADKVSKVDKYRSTPMINKDYDKDRVVLELTFPEDLKLYYALKTNKEDRIK